jgi:phosphomevalonate kinase
VIARAPGKVVISGAYAVLEGAPAVVAAVDRYVVADASRRAPRMTPEVGEALARRGGAAPWFDAAALWDEGRKLGLGSSAAILVASLGALELAIEPDSSDEELARRVLPAALAAHRAAQGGGSGVDVAASALGGVLRFARAAQAPRIDRMTLPEPIVITIWSSRSSASTPDMLARVAAFGGSRPSEHRRMMDRLAAAAEKAADAEDGATFVDACAEQLAVFTELGDAAGAPIVTPEMRAFGRAVGASALVLPSGAGGGDVVLCMGTAPLGDDVENAGRAAGFARLSLSLGARGVHAAPLSWQDLERNEAVP